MDTEPRTTAIPPDPSDVGPWYLEHVEGAAGTWFWSPSCQAWEEGRFLTSPDEMASLGWSVVPDPRTPPIGRTW
jgi:hypothetical protein